MMAGALLYNVRDAARLQKIRFALFKLGISGRTVAPEELSPCRLSLRTGWVFRR